ncbi:MAG: putative glutamine-dependent synthetase [Chlamydiota bacterium]
MAVQLNPVLGDVEGNRRKVALALERAKLKRVDIVLFPELTLTGYIPDDLLLDPALIDAAERALKSVIPLTEGLLAVIGLPRKNPSRGEKPLFNSAAVIAHGTLLGFKDKTLLPTYDIFDERRYFEPGVEEPIWEYKGRKIAVTLCEDMWQHAGVIRETRYAHDPIEALRDKGPHLVLNLSASPYAFGRKEERVRVFGLVAKRLECPVVCCNQVGGNDALLFDGHSFFLDEHGKPLLAAKGFVEDDLVIDLETKACSYTMHSDAIRDLYAALVMGVRDYFHKQGFTKAILGMSGGVDSSLTACIAVEALGQEHVEGYSLPTRYSSPDSYEDAALLASHLGIQLHKYDVDSLFETYLHTLPSVLGSRPWGIVEENLQSRIRGNVLMALANKNGSLLLNTGNKSEMAMGYTTLYGDMCGGLAVLADVVKTRVYLLARHAQAKGLRIPDRVLTRAPTAELAPHQLDSDTLPPYEVLDPILEGYIENKLSIETIASQCGQTESFVREIVARIHQAEYKRRQAPTGLRVTQKAFGVGRRIPIVAKF